MNRALILIMIWFSIETATIKQVSNVLFPNTINTLNPFQIESGGNKNLTVDLTIVCDEDMSKTGLMLKGMNLCYYDIKEKSIDYVNLLLRNITVSGINKSFTAKNPQVTYHYLINSSGTEKLRGEVVQKFNIITAIPLTDITNEVSFREKQSIKPITVARVGDLYLKNSKIQNLQFKFTDGSVLDSLNFQLQGSQITVVLKEQAFKKSRLDLSFKVIDTSNGLESQAINLTVKYDIIKEPAMPNWKKIACAICIILILITMLYVLKTELIETDISLRNHHFPSNEKVEEQSEILTNSILNYKKNSFVDKHDVKTTRDMEMSELNSSISFEINDKSRILASNTRRMDEHSLMEDLEEFSRAIRSQSDSGTDFHN